MSEHQEPEQNAKAQQNKMSLGTKAVLGSGIALTAVYITGKKVWNYFYPPSFKRYFAVAALGASFYGVTHCNDVSQAIGKVYNNVSGKVSIVSHQQKQISSLKDKIEELSEGKVTIQENYSKKENEIKQTQVELSKKQSELSNKEQALQEKDKQLTEVKTNYEKAKTEAEVLKGQLDSRDKTLEKIIKEKKEVPALVSTPAQAFSQTSAKPTSAKSITLQQVQKPEQDQAVLACKLPLFGNLLNSSANYLPPTLTNLESQLVREYSNVIYVNKQDNTLSLYANSNNQLKLVKTYNCSTGLNPSQKTIVGDKATPEGIFGFTFRNFSSDLPPLYGKGSIGTEVEGIIICGAESPDRIAAIKSRQPGTNGGIILVNNDLVDLDKQMGSYWGNAVLVTENPTRPITNQRR